MITFVLDVIFFAGNRKTPPFLLNGRYRPHLVAKSGGGYLGICFEDGEPVSFDKPIQACALPLYPDTVDYSLLCVGAEFFIFEGAKL